jgi:hypothetical protein
VLQRISCRIPSPTNPQVCWQNYAPTSLEFPLALRSTVRKSKFRSAKIHTWTLQEKIRIRKFTVAGYQTGKPLSDPYLEEPSERDDMIQPG